MKKSYLDELREVPLNIPMPMDVDKLNRAVEIASQPAPQKMVGKTERLAVLKEEYAKAYDLYEITDRWDNMSYRLLVDEDYFYRARCLDEMQAIFSLDGDERGDEIRAQYIVPQENWKNYCNAVTTLVKSLPGYIRSLTKQLDRDLQAEEKGVSGEDVVDVYLKKNCMGRVMSSVILPGVRDSEDAPKTAESDLIVICTNGVYVCEVKNYGKYGQTLEVQPNGDIHKFSGRGEFLENMGSPVKQNKRHCQAVQEALHRAGLVNVPVFSVVLIADPDVHVVNKSNFYVTDMYDLCKIVNACREPVLDAQKQQAVFIALQRQRLEERKFPVVAISPVYDELKDIIATMNGMERCMGKWSYEVKQLYNVWVRHVNAVWEKDRTFLRPALFMRNLRERTQVLTSVLGFLMFLVCMVGFLFTYDNPPARMVCVIGFFLLPIRSFWYMFATENLLENVNYNTRVQDFFNDLGWVIFRIIEAAGLYWFCASDLPGKMINWLDANWPF